MSKPFYSSNDLPLINDNPGAMLWELHQAAAYGDKERVCECLEAGAGINGRNPDFGCTALMLAAAGGYWEIAKYLLDYGANPEIKDNGGRTAEQWAIDRHWDDVEELIRNSLPPVERKIHEIAALMRGIKEYGPGAGDLVSLAMGAPVRFVGQKWLGVEYREVLGQHLFFDLWHPKPRKSCPLVVLVHGGGWDGGHRNDPSVSGIGSALLANGFAIATIDYRLAWNWRFPDPLCDLKAAVRHFRSHASEFGIDSERIGVFGHSAGAHLALLLGLTSSNAELEKFSGDTSVSSAVKAVCGISCPCDFETLIDMAESIREAVDTDDPVERKAILEHLKRRRDLSSVLATMNLFDFPLNLRDTSEKETAMLWQRKFEWSRSVRLPRGLVHAESLLEKKEELLLASPLVHARAPQVSGPLPAFLLLHGAKDPLIPAEGCKRFRSALRTSGASVDVGIDRNARHWHREAFHLVPDFFKRTLERC